MREANTEKADAAASSGRRFREGNYTLERDHLGVSDMPI